MDFPDIYKAFQPRILGCLSCILGVSLDTAKIRLPRARAKLKESLKVNYGFYLDKQTEIVCDRKQAAVY